MIRTTLSLCAQGAAVDMFSNNLSIFEVIEDVAPHTYPFVLPRVVYVVAVCREDGDPQVVKAKVVCDLDGKQLFASSITLDFQDKPRTRQVMTLHGLMVEHPGKLRFRLLCKGVLRQTGFTILAKPSVGLPTLGAAKSPKPKGVAKKKTKKR